MHHHNIPTSVWHGQPFQVPALDAGMLWALVKYRNPREQPHTLSLLRNYFIVRKGQALTVVGNEACTYIRVWQFRWWLGWPKSKRIVLAVRKLSERRMPEVRPSTLMPGIHPQVAHELARATLHTENTPRIASDVHTRASLNIPILNVQLNPINDQPTLKSFHDTL